MWTAAAIVVLLAIAATLVLAAAVQTAWRVCLLAAAAVLWLILQLLNLALWALKPPDPSPRSSA